MPNTEMVLVHGWGFSGSHWEPWQHATGSDTAIRVVDRGYFQQPETVNSFSAGAQVRIVVTHSLGLHLCSESLLNQCQLLVVISGFQSFNADGSKTRVLTRMKRKLPMAATEVLNDFYGNCFADSAFQPASKSVSVESLLADLNLLAEHSLSLETIHKVPKILLLHGTADTVTAPQESRKLQAALANSTIALCPDAGHGLPFTHSAWCLQEIYATLKSLHSQLQLNLAITN